MRERASMLRDTHIAVLFRNSYKRVTRRTQPAVHYVRSSALLGVELSGHEADNSSSFRFELKNVWSYTSTSVNEFVG